MYFVLWLLTIKVSAQVFDILISFKYKNCFSIDNKYVDSQFCYSVTLDTWHSLPFPFNLTLLVFTDNNHKTPTRFFVKYSYFFPLDVEDHEC